MQTNYGSLVKLKRLKSEFSDAVLAGMCRAKYQGGENYINKWLDKAF